METIYPTYDLLASREQKEQLLHQKSLVFWTYGQSGSGKTTLAVEVEKRLLDQGNYVIVLDGDNLRSGLNQSLGFSTEDRMENIRRAAEVAKILVNNGAIVIVSLVCPLNSMRNLAKNIIGADFRSMYIKADIDTLIQRDTKGFYQKAKAGEMKNLTGINDTYEEPTSVDIIIETDKYPIEECVNRYFNYINQELNERN